VSEGRRPTASVSGGHRSSLRADCERCFGLCCVAPAFSASADFAIDKDAGQACPNLQSDFRCGIHAHLRPQGFPGCAVYDCFLTQAQLDAAKGDASTRLSPPLASPAHWPPPALW